MTSNTFQMDLECRLTEEEALQRGQEAADIDKDNREIEKEIDGLKAEMKGLKEQHAVNEKEIRRLLRACKDKAENRMVDCRWALNDPKKGQKVIVRQDTLEQVGEPKLMDDRDRQGELKYDSDKPEGYAGEGSSDDTPWGDDDDAPYDKEV